MISLQCECGEPLEFKYFAEDNDEDRSLGLWVSSPTIADKLLEELEG
jgi:hypothetical protein